MLACVGAVPGTGMSSGSPGVLVPMTTPQKAGAAHGPCHPVYSDTILAAHCEIPPISRNTLSRWYRRGGIAPICLVFIGYRASIAEITPFEGGYRTSRGKRSEKGRGYRTQLAMLRHQKPHSAQ